MMNPLSHYVGNADEFPILRQWRFFNHAAVTAIPHRVAQAMRQYVDEAESSAYIGADWYPKIESLRQSVARLINAHGDEIAFIKNTGEGLSLVANALEWKAGDRIVTTNVEYPANIYPWMEVARRFGAELILVGEETDEQGRRRVPLDKILHEAGHARTRMVTLSHVEFASGQRHDLATIGRFCRERGKLLCVDAIQSVGAIPVDVTAMNIDYLSADGHKWLLAPEAAGIFYCRRDLVPRTRPLTIGWMNIVNAMDFGTYDYTLKDTARRFENGSLNVAGLLGLKASVELFLEIGMDAVAGRLKLLTDRLIAGLEERGFPIVSPRDGESWSGITSFTAPHLDCEKLVKTLRQEFKTEISLRVGRLRCSPHFYNTEKQIDQLVQLLPPR
ncbi:MAG: aminotransferase class V-fold PLP-dependent enzyme [Phycisphaerales bacterium]|nr:aminotransferase class V-fold PLP-dependent enzyme [Phycisphaerales bacterium]